MFHVWWHKLTKLARPSVRCDRRPVVPRHARRRLLVLEALEDRTVLSTFFVAPTGNDANTGGAADPFLTIQRGINQAAVNPGPDTVQVASGTYTEQLSISDAAPLTLVGIGKASTVIQMPAALTPDGNGFRHLVTISGGTVDMSRFTLRGPGAPGVQGAITSGIFVRGGASANIHDNIIQDIRDTLKRTEPEGWCAAG